MNNIPQKTSPLPNMLLTIGLLPSSYLVSMTYEEQLLWLCNFLKTEVIPKTNANIEAVNQLITFCENYFNNLNIQEEVNNKIDEMVEDGTLQEIITAYLQVNGVLGYNTKADMKAATNLINGSICKTLGNTNYITGDGSFYKIRTLLNTDVVDEVNIIALTNYPTLIAELIPDYNINQINTQLTSINNNLSLINSKKTLIIGDSFIAEYPTNNWGLQLKSLLGLSDSDITILGEGGAGIYNVGNQDTNFLGLLQANISSITNKNLYTRIIIGGGFNDGNATSVNDILTPMEALINYCKTQFPNAKIYISEFGWTMKYDNTLFRNRINERVIPAYKQCSKFGAYYLDNVEYVMRDTSLYDVNDPVSSAMVHPNENGQKEIAQAIYEALTTGYTPRYKSSNIAFDASTSDDITSASGYFTHMVTPNAHILNMNSSFSASKTYNPDNGLTLDLGLIADPYLRKCGDVIPNFTRMQGRIYTTNSKVYYVDVNMSYDTNGHVFANIPRGLTTASVDITALAIVCTNYFDRYVW